MTQKKNFWNATDIAYIGIMLAIIEVSKSALSFLPNIELTSFWLIMFTLFYRRKTLIIIPALILLEGAVYGMNLWWIMYLYIWPLLILLTWLFRSIDSAFFWAIFSGIFGLCFGALCSLTYFAIGFVNGGLETALQSAFPWWIAGLQWDFIHCIGNFSLMLFLYKPIQTVMKRTFKKSHEI